MAYRLSAWADRVNLRTQLAAGFMLVIVLTLTAGFAYLVTHLLRKREARL